MEIMKTQVSNSGNHFTNNGHVANFKDCAIEKHPSMPSMYKWRIYDCRTKEVKVTSWRSAGNSSYFGYINGECVMIFPYGLNVKERF
jgi:hypothetical protein